MPPSKAVSNQVSKTPEAALKKAVLDALRAPNPDYNITLAEATEERDRLAKLGLQIDLIVAVPVVNFALTADLISESDLVAAGVPADVPFNLSARFQGREDMHNLGLLRKTLRPGTFQSFQQVFNDIYGGADAFGRTAVDLILAVTEVRAAVNSALAAA